MTERPGLAPPATTGLMRDVDRMTAHASCQLARALANSRSVA